MYSSWAKISELPEGSGDYWTSGLVGEIHRYEVFGPSGPNYLPNGGVLIEMFNGQYNGLLSPTPNTLKLSSGQIRRIFPVIGDKVIVLRGGSLHADTVT